MPDLVGRPAAGSVAELRKLGLKPNSVPEPVTDPGQAGLVIAQDPVAGEFVPANTRVRIEIGDHSLFDPREYTGRPPSPAPGTSEWIPPVPSPAELLAYVSQQPWDEDASDLPDGRAADQEHSGAGLESRWPELAGEPDLDEYEDPFAGEEHPGPDADGFHRPTSDVTAPAGPAAGVAYESRWTRKQRNRMLLSFGLLAVLICLTLATRFGAHSHSASGPVSAGSSRIERTRVVTVTVTEGTSTREGRR